MLGLLILFGWRGSTLWVLGTFLGVDLVVEGVTFIVLGSIRRERLLDMGLTSEYVPGRASGHVARGRKSGEEPMRHLAGWASARQEVGKRSWQVELARRAVGEHAFTRPVG